MGSWQSRAARRASCSIPIPRTSVSWAPLSRHGAGTKRSRTGGERIRP